MAAAVSAAAPAEVVSVAEAFPAVLAAALEALRVPEALAVIITTIIIITALILVGALVVAVITAVEEDVLVRLWRPLSSLYSLFLC